MDQQGGQPGWKVVSKGRLVGEEVVEESELGRGADHAVPCELL